LAVFGFVVGIGEKLAKRDHAGAAVRLTNDIFRNEAVQEGPSGPAAGHCWSGIDENAIEIKQDA
jgi:hypothetical protein